MSVCTFLGHSNCPDTVRPALYAAVEELICNRQADMFYVGNHGRFDVQAQMVLEELVQKYPHIRYAVVLAYMPGKRREFNDYSNTMLPEGIETIHPRYAISWRNNWMVNQSDFVIAYITHTWGGAYQFVRKAEHRGKTIIHLN